MCSNYIYYYTNLKSKESSFDDKAMFVHETTFEETLDKIPAINCKKKF